MTPALIAYYLNATRAAPPRTVAKALSRLVGAGWHPEDAARYLAQR